MSNNTISSPTGSSTAAMVPKSQYDELLRRYEVLSRKMEDMKDGQQMGTSGLMREASLEGAAPVNRVKPSVVAKRQSPPLKSLGGGTNALRKSIDTVDVFEEVNKKSQAPIVSYDDPNSEDGNLEPVDADLENEIFALRKAIDDLRIGKLDRSMKSLKKLEMSRHPQIIVRSKFHIGRLLMKQQIFDLALQTFEEIIQNHAYSSVVLDALKQSIACSEKLNLTDKKTQYKSLLKDVFGVN